MAIHNLPGLEHTSENTVVYNLLHDMVKRLERRFRRRLTVISPTAYMERRYPFDALIEGLPPGRLCVYQFKRPHPTRVGCVTFHIDRDQHSTLLYRFGRTAQYVFCPVPWTLDFVHRRQHVLDYTYSPYVHSIPILGWPRKLNRTRTIRYPDPLSRAPELDCFGITDPKKYFPLPDECKLKWKDVERKVRETGIRTGKEGFPKKDDQKIRKGTGRVFYIHIPNDESSPEMG